MIIKTFTLLSSRGTCHHSSSLISQLLFFIMQPSDLLHFALTILLRWLRGCNVIQRDLGHLLHPEDKNLIMAHSPWLKPIFTDRNIKIYTKSNTLKNYIWSILLHGCECWAPTNDLERRLEAAEMWYIGRIMRLSWTEKKSNEEVMEMAGYKRSLSKPSETDNCSFFFFDI